MSVVSARTALADRSRPFPKPASVQLLEVDPDLASGLSADERAFAQRQLIVPAIHASVGDWTPEKRITDAFVVLVLEGLFTRDSVAIGQPDFQLFGPGDVLDPDVINQDQGTFRVLLDAQLALIDAQAMLVLRRCPGLMPQIIERLFQSAAEQHHLATLRALSRVEDRLMALLGHQALRWGRVTAKGVFLHLPLTHEELGRLVGSRRPTVSLALTQLIGEGRLARPNHHDWLLPLSPPTVGVAIPRAVPGGQLHARPQPHSTVRSEVEGPKSVQYGVRPV